MQLQRLNLQVGRDGRVAESAVEGEAAVGLVVPLLGAQSVAGGQNGGRMAAEPQRFGHVFTAVVERAGGVGRVQISQY